jgi:phage tail-like protein
VVLSSVSANGANTFQGKVPFEVQEFRVEIDSLNIGEFRAVDGVGVEVEVIESEDGDELNLKRRPIRLSELAYKHSPPDRTMWRPLWDWWQECVANKCVPKTVSIHAFDESQEKLGTWELKDAFPKNVVKDDGLEEVTFQYSHLEFIESE